MPDQTFKVTYGGWYQRTTLHLSEVHYLFLKGESHLALSKEKLKSLQAALELRDVSREPGYFEYVKAVTKSGIEIRYYEDGLYILEIEGEHTEDLETSHKLLEEYYKTKLSPALA